MSGEGVTAGYHDRREVQEGGRGGNLTHEDMRSPPEPIRETRGSDSQFSVGV